jgi:hypothetical protein
MLANTDPIKQRLKRLHVLLESPVFNQASPEDGSWKSAFAELIILLDDLLAQAQQAGQRVDFWEGVGVHGKIQDVTSLVAWLRAFLPVSVTDLAAQFDNNRLNRYFGQGTGYFENGAFFTCEQAGDLAFFLDDQRIYLNRQIRRAITEAELSVQHELIS